MLKKLLQLGEYALNFYNVQYVHWQDDEVRGNGFWLKAVVTNRRVLIFPDSHFRAGNADVIHPSDIVRVWNVCLRGRDAIMLMLRDGRRLYMLVDWSQGSKLARDINSMLTPAAKPRISPRLPN
jgi:hypothetical protein